MHPEHARKDEKENRRRSSVDLRLEPGDVCRYIKRALEVIGNETPIVIVARVSTSQQDRRLNLHDQLRNLRQWAVGHRAVIIGEVQHVGRGADCYWLRQAAELARQHGAVLLAESVDRFIRHPGFNPKTCSNLQPRERELEELQACTEGMILATLLPPEATPEEIRSFQRRRGQTAKGRKGGRPLKAEHRVLLDAVWSKWRTLTH